MSSESTIRCVNKSQLASLFNKHTSTIDAWVRRGMPYVQVGDKAKEWLFDVADVVKWREQQAIESVTGNTKDVEYEEAKRRKIAAEAGILEIELQQRRSEVIVRAEVEQGLSNAYITIKQRLRTIPERIIPQIISETDERLCNELLLNEIDDALLELSNITYHAGIAEPSQEASSPATKIEDL